VKSARRDSNWDVITKRVMHRTVHCPANSAACDPILLFLTNVIDKKAYFFQVGNRAIIVSSRSGDHLLVCLG
jgi:hypothetical protein